MCENRTCPLRNECYRFTATPSDWQSFAMFEWFFNADRNADCEDKIPLVGYNAHDA